MNQAEIGTFIAGLRKEKGMTQEALGERIGVTNKTVSRWENGNYMPGMDVIPLLCTELGITINELMCARRLEDPDFRKSADENLIKSMKQVKKLKHDKSIIDFLTGAGTGILFSCLYSPHSFRRIIILAVGLTMIVVGWHKKSQYDRCVFEYIGKADE